MVFSENIYSSKAGSPIEAPNGGTLFDFPGGSVAEDVSVIGMVIVSKSPEKTMIFESILILNQQPRNWDFLGNRIDRLSQ